MSQDTQNLFDRVSEGDSIPGYRVVLSKENYFAYNKLVGEINPLHFNEDYARKLGFRDPVVAGVFTFALIPRLIEAWTGRPGSCGKVEIKFVSPLYVGDAASVGGRVVKKYSRDGGKFADCEVFVENDDKVRVITATVSVKF